jgi:hypothetical protein
VNTASADPMRIRRTLPILLILLLVVAVVAAIVTLLGQAPPEAVRLLPGADGFVYLNLKWIRTFSGSLKLPPVSRDPEYQQFIDATGFEFERDLDEAAFSVHYPESWGNGTGGSAPEARFSEVFVGKFDSNRLVPYLKKIASSVDTYRNFDIYNIPQEGRTVRVVVLSYNSVAVSNHPDPAVIHGILDRSRKLASPFAGPSLLRKFYRHVPVASTAFAIFRIQPAAMNSIAGLSTWTLLFPKPAIAVVSARYLRAMHMRADIFASSDSDAADIAERTGTFLSLFHAAESSVGPQGTDADVKAFFASLKVEHSGDRAIVTATVPLGFIQKIVSAPTGAGSTGEASPAPPPPQKSLSKPSKPTKKP